MNQIRSLEQIQKDEIVRALELFSGDKIKAAAALGISLRTIQIKIIQFNLEDFHLRPGRPRLQMGFSFISKTGIDKA